MPGRTADFPVGLAGAVRQLNSLAYQLKAESGASAFLQLGGCTTQGGQIHRLWASQPGRGAGVLLDALCQLADAHEVGIKLKVVPFGPEPTPLDRVQLRAGYGRHGFEGPGWKLRRMPGRRASCDPPDLTAARGSG